MTHKKKEVTFVISEGGRGCRLNCEVDRWQQIARNPVEYG